MCLAWVAGSTGMTLSSACHEGPPVSSMSHHRRGLPPLQPRLEGSGARGCAGRARGFWRRTMWFSPKTFRSNARTIWFGPKTFRSSPKTIWFRAKTFRFNPKTIRSNAKTFRFNRWNNAPHAQRRRVDGVSGAQSGVVGLRRAARLGCHLPTVVRNGRVVSAGALALRDG